MARPRKYRPMQADPLEIGPDVPAESDTPIAPDKSAFDILDFARLLHLGHERLSMEIERRVTSKESIPQRLSFTRDHLMHALREIDQVCDDVRKGKAK